ncbi:hypothetical protein [Agrococcus jenensis]|uniref:DUF4878 domain-containing protein n=1 Tax=Agrococcus jenensis TaxID=46353 RepID=A0A3N2APZ8_9MICO|nr:hypothetical protein [Agrococcus jenensis]ROR65123.1 hypothetical protein EDD26_0485 [Agrococcus jenensis]
MPSPEFVMPEPAPVIEAPVEPPPVRDPRSSAPDSVAERDLPEPFARPRRPWRQLVIAALIGVLVGAGLPTAMQGIDQAAADARIERLRQTAMDYLTAIAEGASDRATAMAPVEGETPPDAVLQSADRLDEPEVRMTTVDGDAATVEVRYRVAGQTVTRALEAEEVDGAWQLRTSIAEPTMAYTYEGYAAVTIAGVELPSSRRTLLYPGAYESDRVEGSLVVSGGNPIIVDGDPLTPTELVSTMELAPGLDELAQEVAVAHVRACDAECTFEPDAALRVDGPWVMGEEPTGAVNVSMQVYTSAFSGQTVEMQLRAIVDEAGTLVSWQCAMPSASEFELEPCRG